MSTNFVYYNTSSMNYSVQHDFDTLGYICSPEYYAADIDVTADLSQENSILSFDEDEFRNQKQKIDMRHINTARFQDVFMSKNWSYHLWSVTADRPLVGGPTVLLSAIYNFSIIAMINDASFVEKATQMKQRYFGEVIVDAISSLPVSSTEAHVGTVSTVRRRITTVSIAALTLAITLGIQLLLICGVYFTSRLSRRPLGLLRDPASALAAASLLTGDENTRQAFRDLDHVPESQIVPLLSQNRYKLQHGSLRALQDYGAESHIGMSRQTLRTCS